ncbi:MAG: ABC transporter ATP-binding protein [Lachnospiraceae bacterium]|nr:ABC transporter ATP-binding protein [Lachnospiraceae bacterium]MBO6300354.1 ABC transporter ATP-binding protein [Lachnospiraceae bacterium]
MAETILEVKDFGIEFHDHDKPERVVEHVSFSLKKGEILGIVGESGSGKSMSALAIAGLLPRKKLKKEGQILFLGEDLMTMERKKLRGLQGDEISMIFQEPMTALNPTMKIGLQVEEALRIHHPEVSAEERKKRALTWLKNVEMDDPERVYESYPHELSGGMRQRVMIAAAMVGNPQLLIADECTTALDVTVQAQIIRLLLEINKKEQVSVLFISHDLSLIRQISHRVIVMQLGHIVEQGEVEQIFSHPKEEYTKKLIAAIPQVEL